MAPYVFCFTNLQANYVRSNTLQITIKPAKLAVIALIKRRKIFCFVAFYDIF